MADQVWKQTKRTHDAMRKLRVKQADVAADRASANALPVGPERAKRRQAAEQRDAEARRVYSSEISRANAARTAALAKSS